MSFDAMSPWDAVTWFETPTVTYVSVTVATLKQVVAANVRRVYLAFISQNQAGHAYAPNTTPFTGKGYISSSNVPSIEFRFADHGPLVTSEWFVYPAATITVTVVEVILRDWPRDKIVEVKNGQPADVSGELSPGWDSPGYPTWP